MPRTQRALEEILSSLLALEALESEEIRLERA